MRILQVNDFRAGGGAEVVVDETIRLLEAAGHQVDLFTGDAVRGRRTAFSYLTNHRAIRALEARIASFRPDALHFHNVYHVLSPGVLSARTPPGRRPRRLLTAHDFHLVCPNSGARRFTPAPELVDATSLRDRAWIRRQRWDHRSRLHAMLKLAQHRRHYGGGIDDARRRLDVVLCPGERAAAFLRAAGLPAHLEVVPNPFDADAVRRQAASAAAAGTPAAPGVLRLAFVGRVEPEKGLADLLAAWPAEAPPAVLDVLGGGDELERVRSARPANTSVRCHGPVPRATALATIAAADGLVVPSRTPEVAPIVLLEALALGTPVIATDTGAMREVREATGQGHPLDAASPHQLGHSLAVALGALTRTDAASPLRDGAAATIEAFLHARRPDRYVAKLEALYATSGPGERVAPTA